MSAPKERLAGLDLLRFLAACLVMVFHLGFWIWHGQDGHSMLPVLAHYPQYPELTGFQCGWVGVEIFFVISGFVIAYSADNSSAFSFMRSRILRLAPALYVCSVVSFGALLLAGLAPLSVALADLGRTWILWPIGPWVDAVYWTLVIEVIFYASIMGLLLSNKFHLISRFAIGLGLLSATYNLALFVTPLHFSRPAAFLLLRHGVFFALGALLWLSFFKRTTVLRSLVIGLCLVGGGAETAGAAMTYPGPVWPPVVVWAASVVAIVAAVRYRSVLAALPARTIGLATYPLYLLHEIVGGSLLNLLSGAGLSRWPALAITCLLIVLASVAFVRLAEPIIKTGLRRALHQPPGLPAWLSRNAQPVS